MPSTWHTTKIADKMAFRSFAPSSTAPRQLYHLLTSAVVPRPIAWVSTRSAAGVTNLAPFSFFNVMSIDPPILAITQVYPKPGSDKDTLLNLRATNECVVNFVPAHMAELMNATSKDYPHGVSEIEKLEIPTIQSTQVQVPGVAGSPIRMECTLRDVLEIGNGKTMLLNVIEFQVNQALFSEGDAIDGSRAPTLGRMGNNDYTTTSQLLEMLRPPFSA
ncbi:hypothetical protein SDRG_04906 [Saprolegnia diclina VS20]|uniref:Flavin reductase like domain-containing protein n=1 Tax=Saprolegnia diclina (strain VS20) TaxID=1156394 RepID=T0QV33_SAPDV|nr:hypothetical protein SDRG_04906 [Saprolegnia diclina VS20]EQC37885.1 hypothetical protein SDRG_04906 [Saprolegnia diclina VS20]|eukprot:XP_008608818.1 hypothetical protein SDRG_04906 [Saprolegnia diclina VS20]